MADSRKDRPGEKLRDLEHAGADLFLGARLQEPVSLPGVRAVKLEQN